ncbi:hypothetical protein BU24DRAFT_480309 [Aaosphaeria arxii CBS 175.79]|uniref:MYND-type domain-containing protein n=1 Tax=Aaosphaeria arxii CBS 175.79 TaxID=1450172 RepID=A0A6A5XRN3_9PLEO|nr:uncharacterized protein BU24DRAFT_480309 [Aaosphaeria arxii CBS 175.79]KAF2015556.1 hypothetical protein BU24DRAFT_480309 [Aaosphaeria arxii CBS 175.79]
MSIQHYGCEICSHAASTRCRGCLSSRYCSESCQKAGWTKHKLVCKTYKDFSDDKRPGPAFHRGILFPEDDKHPRFVWLEFERRDFLDRAVDMIKTNLIGSDAVGAQFKSIGITDAPRAPTLTRSSQLYSIVLERRDAISIDGRQINVSINNLFEKRHIQRDRCSEWRGPVVAFGMSVNKNDESLFEACDLHTVDLRLAGNAVFKGEFPTTTLDLQLETLVSRFLVKSRSTQADTVLGVRINCEGDASSNRREPLELVTIPRDHSIFQVTVSPALSEQLGFPLLMKALPCDWDPKMAVLTSCPYMEGDMPGACNDTVCDLYMLVDPTAPKHCASGSCLRSNILKSVQTFTSSGELKGTGSVLVVRQDRKDLSVQHVEAMHGFANLRLAPALLPQIDALKEGQAVDKDAVSQVVTKERFQEFFEQWDDAHPCSCHQFGHPSPYEVDGAGEED